MKITKQDYSLLKQAIVDIPSSVAKIKWYLSQSDKQYRWMLFHYVNVPSEFKFGYLHEYLNDEHIDTALRRIVKEIKVNKLIEDSR